DRAATILDYKLKARAARSKFFMGSGGQNAKPIHARDSSLEAIAVKVPQVTLAFWIVKILATTLGETGGDAVTMSWLGETTPEAQGTGYLIGTGIFGVIF